MEKKQVAAMFDDIAHKYDFLNHFLSLGIDKLWRRRLVKMLKKQKPATILDVATGTGDLAIACLKAKPGKITGVDISEEMLNYGRQKMLKKGLDNIIELKYGDSENLEFPAETFDAVTVAFGVRNFENLTKGLREMHRVLKKDGKVYILEFSMPKRFPMKQLYRFYFFAILPLIGKVFSGNSKAYRYLPESVEQFPQYEVMLNIMDDVGFCGTKYVTLTGGIATIYIGTRV